MKVNNRTLLSSSLFFLLLVVSPGSLAKTNDDDKSSDFNTITAHLTQTTDCKDDDVDVVRIRRVVPIMFSNRNILDTDQEGTVITCGSSIEEFPSFFTESQREQGAIVVPFLIAIYSFTIIAIICDNYFLPCVDRICKSLDLSQDVAAATFMSIATSAPELFANIIGTFITQSDIGIGTVVGSSMFNTLGVASIGGLAATSPIRLDWWPLTRDCVIYICSIILLVAITWDGKVYWFEALILFVVYFIYLIVMFQNVRISRFFRALLRRFRSKKVSGEPTGKPGTNELSSVSCIDDEVSRHRLQITLSNQMAEKKVPLPETQEETDEQLFTFPRNSWTKQAFFLYTWPIRFVLFCTVPDCRKHHNVFPITFIMCVFWIGTNAYLVSWMVTVIGYTFGIQDSILGLTFLAAGGCLPEAISITITSRKGEGAMGVSNALGANTMNILLSLGLPWFIKTLVMVANEGSSKAQITIVSGSLEYTIFALIIVAFTLYVTLFLNKFQLSRKTGLILMFSYVFFIVLAILSEMYLFPNEPC